MTIIGIDLGTTNSLCSIWQNGKVVLIPNRLGSFQTPSVVSIDEEGGLVVGEKNNWITLEKHGRDGITMPVDVSRTVGWFTALFPVAPATRTCPLYTFLLSITLH